MKIKVGVVSFLNSAPLWWGMKEDKNVEIYFRKPPYIKQLLSNGFVDLAILPTYEFFKGDFVSASSLAILSKEKSLSVLLFSYCKLNEIQKIYLDTRSKTSSNMVKHIFSNSPIKFERKIKEFSSLESFESQLLIGDDALKKRNANLEIYDVADLWKKKTNHTSIFALWAKNKEKESFDYNDFLIYSYKKGIEKIGEIIEYGSSKLNIDKKTLREYFTKNLHYIMDDEDFLSLKYYGEVFGKKG